MLSPSPSKRSPSLKKERTNYRTDFGWRTIRTYETPVKHSARPEANYYPSNNEYVRYSPRRSQSPKLRSELTDYRTESNYRTVRYSPKRSRSPRLRNEPTADRPESNYRTETNYETPNKNASNDLENTNIRDYYYERQSATKRSPKLRAEPTNYREETNFRTVRVYDHTLHADDYVEEKGSQRKELESDVKQPQEKGEKKDAGSVAKKLEFEQQDTKGAKENAQSQRAASRNLADSKSASGRKAQGQSQFKTHEELFLVKTLNYVVNYDKQLENQKNILASCLDFTIQGAYKKLVDESGKDGGSKAQFEENVRRLGIFFTQTESDAVFKRFDADGDGKISYHEFENVIYPVSRPYARMIRLRIDEQPLSKETLGLFIEFLKLVGSIEGAIEDLRTKVSRRVSLEEAYKALDSRARGNVEIHEFKKLLENHGFYPESNDLRALNNRVDLNEDGVITPDEFNVSMSPVKGGK